ncbi:MAG: hypothetical protein HY695_17085 [Deltaproteobacteria bacterium]|nr:hypothetical protein [Deltaproteobacteria bacterium]
MLHSPALGCLPIKRFNRFSTFLFSLALSFLIASESWPQGTQDPTIAEAARNEGKVVWYTSISLDYSKAIAGRLQRKYPAIKVEIVRSGTGALLNRILNESRARMHAWDVISGSAEMYLPLMERKVLASYRSSEASGASAPSFSARGSHQTTENSAGPPLSSPARRGGGCPQYFFPARC